MKTEELTTIEHLSNFLEGTQAVAFTISSDKDKRYRWLQKELVRFDYLSLNKPDKGIVIRYLLKVSGYSRQQLTRLIAQYRKTGRLSRQQRTTAGFKRRYTDRDIRLLAEMDERHDTPCGHAIKKLCERAYQVFGQSDYETLAGISVSHLYNLRQSNAYQRQRRTFEKTRPKSSTIGERRKPCSNGQPGYIRIDTVHQGDLDKQKGVYHINAVDEVTQFEVVCCVERISERYLIPALEQLLETFPFLLWFRAFIPITVLNISTGKWPSYWKSSVSSSPNPAPDTVMTMLWQKARTEPWSGSCLDTNISRNVGHLRSMPSIMVTTHP
ncbi:hypothetical protein [Thiolapillus sp.]|uniref:hypothetical protein n=1 Tax=Thiolapillus sp. TaxID=2017437 RepID=UPI003AF88143